MESIHVVVDDVPQNETSGEKEGYIFKNKQNVTHNVEQRY